MKQEQTEITGVVLAGGLARRMGGGDKGLIPFQGQPLAAYALRALSEITDRIVINANRNLAAYRRFGYPVIPDRSTQFDGPLAGVLSVMKAVEAAYVLTVPCDSPLVQGKLLKRMVTALRAERAEICVAHDGRRAHPVFMLLKRDLRGSLESYLAKGERKIDAWYRQHKVVQADYSDHPEMFENINTPQELAALEERMEGGSL